MKMSYNKFIVQAIAALAIYLQGEGVQAQLPLSSGIAYSVGLGCGSCVAGGYNFCWKTSAPGVVLADDKMPAAVFTDKTNAKIDFTKST